jgi:hypothetical protein
VTRWRCRGRADAVFAAKGRQRLIAYSAQNDR